MKTLVYLKDEQGDVYCEEPALRLGQKLNPERFMNQLNKNMKAGHKYTEVLLVEECENFFNYTHKKNHINKVMADNNWSH